MGVFDGMTLTYHGKKLGNLNIITKLDKTLGIPSAYGKVYKIRNTNGITNKYVLKVMIFNDYKNDQIIFRNEVEIGSIPGIEEVGPRIYAWKIENGQGQYIMDHVEFGSNTVWSMTLKEYLMKQKNGTCPKNTPQLIKKLRDTLINFYKITGGRHGDLHYGNIMVILNRDLDVTAFRIIDYGAHRKFNLNKLGKPSCLGDYLKAELKGSYKNMSREYPNFANLKIRKYNSGGQMYTNNEKRLKNIGVLNNLSKLNILNKYGFKNQENFNKLKEKYGVNISKFKMYESYVKRVRNLNSLRKAEENFKFATVFNNNYNLIKSRVMKLRKIKANANAFDRLLHGPVRRHNTKLVPIVAPQPKPKTPSPKTPSQITPRRALIRRINEITENIKKGEYRNNEESVKIENFPAPRTIKQKQMNNFFSQVTRDKIMEVIRNRGAMHYPNKISSIGKIIRNKNKNKIIPLQNFINYNYKNFNVNTGYWNQSKGAERKVPEYIKLGIPRYNRYMKLLKAVRLK
jgi:hypothetical protein